MPIDLEMLLSASNHAFFPYSTFNNTGYSDNPYDHSLPFPRNHCVPRSHDKHGLFHKKYEHHGFDANKAYKFKDKVLFRQELCSAPKKKVSFADDKGLNLVEVREIPGAPKWADDVITLLVGNSKRTVVKEKKWKVAFDNPPWTDEKLLEMIEKNMIVLENISVKEGADDFLVGTIKVRNLAFEKKVFLRVTFDRWLSYIDVPCSYVMAVKGSSNSMYDTFQFSTKILPVASRYEVIECCLYYQCDGKEYWDNNKGINYRLIVEYVKSSVPDLHQMNMPSICSNKFHSDAERNRSNELFLNYKLMHGSYC